jgi:D-serine deaminase-like pyridoxal phosphate-dependent protein
MCEGEAVHVAEIPTPALVVDATALRDNIATMADALPGPRLRPHVKAHKCTELARHQAAAGHSAFTCATVGEMVGMVKAGLGDDLLLANEVVDPRQLGRLSEACERSSGVRITVCVDSVETVAAAAAAGLREVLVDVQVGMPRCGCPPEEAGAIAGAARSAGLEVRGVMGYEGHIVGLEDREQRDVHCAGAMELLEKAHQDAGGDVISAGGTGTYDLNRLATEIQAGSYVLMDSAYGKLGLPFRQALYVLSTVISSSAGWSVLDCGLKSLSVDHGNPEVPGASVWFCSDEHTTFSPPLAVGERVKVTPSHIDPTVACNDTMYLLDGEDEVLETWPVDLRTR